MSFFDVSLVLSYRLMGYGKKGLKCTKNEIGINFNYWDSSSLYIVLQRIGIV